MANLFYVFWLPRMYHKELSVLDTASSIINEEISDEIVPGIHHITIEIDKENKENHDIRIKSRRGESKETSIVLKYINASHNGLIQYQYEADNRNHEANFICKAIPNAIYHLIKSFFHSHEYHHPKGDSTLLAYVSDSEVDIKEQDNAALTFYLGQYEKKFRGYRELAFEKLQFIQDKNEESAEEYYLNYLRRHKYLDRFCDKALGESLYYETLLYSWYNGSCKYNQEKNCCASCGNSDDEGESCKQLHRLALNTKNAIDSIRNIKQCNKNLFDYKNSEYTIKALEGIEEGNQQNNTLIQEINRLIDSGNRVSERSYFVGRVSIGLGVLSVVLAILPFCLDKEIHATPIKIEKLEIRLPSPTTDSILPQEKAYPNIKKATIPASKR